MKKIDINLETGITAGGWANSFCAGVGIMDGIGAIAFVWGWTPPGAAVLTAVGAISIGCGIYAAS